MAKQLQACLRCFVCLFCLALVLVCSSGNQTPCPHTCWASTVLLGCSYTVSPKLGCFHLKSNLSFKNIIAPKNVCHLLREVAFRVKLLVQSPNFLVLRPVYSLNYQGPQKTCLCVIVSISIYYMEDLNRSFKNYACICK